MVTSALLPLKNNRTLMGSSVRHRGLEGVKSRVLVNPDERGKERGMPKRDVQVGSQL